MPLQVALRQFFSRLVIFHDIISPKSCILGYVDGFLFIGLLVIIFSTMYTFKFIFHYDNIFDHSLRNILINAAISNPHSESMLSTGIFTRCLPPLLTLCFHDHGWYIIEAITVCNFIGFHCHLLFSFIVLCGIKARVQLYFILFWCKFCIWHSYNFILQWSGINNINAVHTLILRVGYNTAWSWIYFCLHASPPPTHKHCVWNFR